MQHRPNQRPCQCRRLRSDGLRSALAWRRAFVNFLLSAYAGAWNNDGVRGFVVLSLVVLALIGEPSEINTGIWLGLSIATQAFLMIADVPADG